MPSSFCSAPRDSIFPRYILDESLGIHADRARGPFLQAVANGVTLNLLGLVALDSFRRRRLKGLSALLLLIARAAGDSGDPNPGGVALLRRQHPGLAALFLRAREFAGPVFCLILAGAVGLLAALSFDDEEYSFFDRLEERSPVEFRVVMYRTGLEMFLEKPCFGWGAGDLQPELAKRVHEFHQSAFFFHNTYLEIAVQHGLLGLALYLWVVVDLVPAGLRSGEITIAAADGNFLDEQFPFALASSGRGVSAERQLRGDELPVCKWIAVHYRRNPGSAESPC